MNTKRIQISKSGPSCLFGPHPVFTIIDPLGHLMNPKWQGNCVFANMPITNNHFNCSLKSEIRSLSDPAFSAIVRIDEKRDSYFTKFETSNFACPQVMLLGSLVSEQLLFLLYNLSFPCGYFWSATSSFTLKLQWRRPTKIWFGDNFWLRGHIDPRSTRLSCILHDLLRDTPLNRIWLAPICGPNTLFGVLTALIWVR